MQTVHQILLFSFGLKPVLLAQGKNMLLHTVLLQMGGLNSCILLKHG